MSFSRFFAVVSCLITVAIVFVIVRESIDFSETETDTHVASETEPDTIDDRFSAIASIKKRKRAFVDFLLPYITAHNAALHRERLRVLSLTPEKIAVLCAIGEEYAVPLPCTVENFDAMQKATVRRLDVLPPSLVLAQAAIESAWGTSRFAREGNNLFGLWCVHAGCGTVPKKRSAGDTHEVRTFVSVADGIAAYYHTLNTGAAYTLLRKLREQQRMQKTVDSVALANGLRRYSARGSAYVVSVQKFLTTSGFRRFDTHTYR